MNHTLELNADNKSIQVITFTGRYLSVIEATGSFELKIPDKVGFVVDVVDDIDLGAEYSDGVQAQIVNRAGVTNIIEIADAPVKVLRKKKVSLDVDALPVELVEGSEVKVSNLTDIPAPVVNVPDTVTVSNLADIPAPVVNVPDTVTVSNLGDIPAPVVTVPPIELADKKQTIETIDLNWSSGQSQLVKKVNVSGVSKVFVHSTSQYIELLQGDSGFRLPYKNVLELDNLSIEELSLKILSGSAGHAYLVLFRDVVVLPNNKPVMDVIPKNAIVLETYENHSVLLSYLFGWYLAGYRRSSDGGSDSIIGKTHLQKLNPFERKNSHFMVTDTALDSQHLAARDVRVRAFDIKGVLIATFYNDSEGKVLLDDAGMPDTELYYDFAIQRGSIPNGFKHELIGVK